MQPFAGRAGPAYRTLNDPAHPPQQIDYDDGLYLPVSFLAEAGNPVIAASGYFRIVEILLTPLCRKRGWSLDRTTKKCVRIVLDDHAHIDLPRYAIPDQEFHQLVEDAAWPKRPTVISRPTLRFWMTTFTSVCHQTKCGFRFERAVGLSLILDCSKTGSRACSANTNCRLGALASRTHYQDATIGSLASCRDNRSDFPIFDDIRPALLKSIRYSACCAGQTEKFAEERSAARFKP